MPIRALPSFKSEPDKLLQIAQPGIGGLNLKDLEYEQEVNQSPYMLNMMYRNGAFSKRYGQEIYKSFEDKIYATVYFAGSIIVHSETKVYKGETQIATGLPEKKGLFMKYAQSLYYLVDNKFYEYKYDNDTSSQTYGTYVWKEVEPYVPTAFYSAKPDGSTSENGDNFNVLASGFTVAYNGDGTTKTFKAYGDTENIIDWSGTITVNELINDVKTPRTDFTVDATNKTITFTGSAPASGGDNLEVTFPLKTTAFENEKNMILNAKYYATFGNADNSRLFLAGFGDFGRSCYFYSEPYDASYFSPFNYEYIGNSEEDIKGFGLQYNVLFIFKAKEIYSVGIYTQTFATTQDEDLVGSEAFKTQLVNANIGCDAPYSIQLIDNKLTWFNSVYGICTLVSTNIVDERNVRVISRNIEKTNNFGVVGILDHTEDLNTIQSVDYDNKYFLVFPESGMCYMWDYGIQSYYYSSDSETEAKNLDWFMFDKFYVETFLKAERELVYISSNDLFEGKLIKLNESYDDLDFNDDGESDGINAYYMTPFYQFNAVEMLKNVKKIFVQTRGDTASVIDMYYYTENNILGEGEKETESIRIGGRLWNHFSWENFQWLVVNWANTFMRKCSLKKVQMVSFLFKNDEVGRDMSMSHISLQYSLVKYIK